MLIGQIRGYTYQLEQPGFASDQELDFVLQFVDISYKL